VIADVAGGEGESAVLVASLGRFQRDLAVLDHLVLAVHSAHNADGLFGEGFFHGLHDGHKLYVLPRSD
jgi:hypothetical protein